MPQLRGNDSILWLNRDLNDSLPARFSRVGSLDNHYFPRPSRILMVSLIITITPGMGFKGSLPKYWLLLDCTVIICD
jgi:hypothetical protein